MKHNNTSILIILLNIILSTNILYAQWYQLDSGTDYVITPKNFVFLAKFQV